MHNLPLLCNCCVFILSFIITISQTEKDTLRANVEKAIISILIDSYGGLNGTLNAQQLESLIVATTGEGNDEASEANIPTYIEISNACSYSGNLTACRQVIDKWCLSSNIISSIYATSELKDFTDVFPALIYHQISNACSIDDEDGRRFFKTDHEKPSSTIAWGYGLGFSFLVIVISNIGGCMVPFRKKQFFHRILMFCVALAVGTLAGTGFLVLIPESMHLTGEDSPIPGYQFKLSTALGGIYFFYVCERLLKTLMRRKKKRKNSAKELALMSPKGMEIPALANGGTLEDQHGGDDDDDTDFTALDVRKGGDANAKKVNPVAWLVLTGDALHNLVDGMSIGAAFTENIYTGISVSLAVLCEELPHELGDIAILHHAGLSMKRALLYNFFAALTVLVGLVIGILLGENTEANTWIFAGAGGMFIYISLVDILPEMGEQAKHLADRGKETATVIFIIQSLGLVIGFTIIFLLVMYGKYIQV